MSLLLDALKRAEQEKLAKQGERAANDPPMPRRASAREARQRFREPPRAAADRRRRADRRAPRRLGEARAARHRAGRVPGEGGRGCRARRAQHDDPLDRAAPWSCSSRSRVGAYVW